MSDQQPSSRTVAPESGAKNQVTVRGRVAAEPVGRVLPSGAEITGFRVIIDRASTEMTRGSQQKSDWIECTAWTKQLRRRVEQWQPGDVVEVEGSLRRRFLRGGASMGSLVDIEMLDGRMIERARPDERTKAPTTETAAGEVA